MAPPTIAAVASPKPKPPQPQPRPQRASAGLAKETLAATTSATPAVFTGNFIGVLLFAREKTGGFDRHRPSRRTRPVIPNNELLSPAVPHAARRDLAGQTLPSAICCGAANGELGGFRRARVPKLRQARGFVPPRQFGRSFQASESSKKSSFAILPESVRPYLPPLLDAGMAAI